MKHILRFCIQEVNILGVGCFFYKILILHHLWTSKIMYLPYIYLFTYLYTCGPTGDYNNIFSIYLMLFEMFYQYMLTLCNNGFHYDIFIHVHVFSNHVLHHYSPVSLPLPRIPFPFPTSSACTSMSFNFLHDVKHVILHASALPKLVQISLFMFQPIQNS